MAIKLIQILCPARHCLLATAYDDAEHADPLMLAAFKEQWCEVVARKMVHPWCGICGSPEVRFEVGTTRFRTLDEAWPALARESARNLATRGAIERARARED